MARPSKGPWFSKERQRWFVMVSGRRLNLGQDEMIAREKWVRIHALPEHMRGLMASRLRPDVRRRLREARREGRVIERAAALHLAAQIGVSVRFGSPRASMASGIGVSDFDFLPDAWAMTENPLEVVFIEIEHTAPMSLTKMLEYAKLAERIRKKGGTFTLYVGDRYGSGKKVDIEAFAKHLLAAKAMM